MERNKPTTKISYRKSFKLEKWKQLFGWQAGLTALLLGFTRDSIFF